MAPRMSSLGRRVLVALDLGEESRHALTQALEHLIRKEDELHLIHAQTLPDFTVGPPGIGMYLSAEVMEALREQQTLTSKSILEAGLELCSQYGVHAEAEVIEGDPRDAICDAVEQLGIDILVIGSHSYGSIKRALLGSVSDHCLHHAACPVVVVRKVGRQPHNTHRIPQ